MITTSRVLLTAGGLLQFVGVCLVLVEISQVQTLLKRPEWTRAALDGFLRPLRALADKIRPRKGQVALVGTAKLSISAGRPELRVTVHDPVGGSVVERLEAHRRQLDEHERQLEAARADLQEHRANVGGRIDALESAIHEETRQLQKVVDELGAGSLRIRGIGVVLILLGTVLTTVGAWL